MIFLLFCSFMVGLVDDRSAKSVLGLDFCWIFLVYILKCFEFFLCVLTPLCRMQQSCSHSSVSAIVAGRNALVVFSHFLFVTVVKGFLAISAAVMVEGWGRKSILSM